MLSTRRPHWLIGMLCGLLLLVGCPRPAKPTPIPPSPTAPPPTAAPVTPTPDGSAELVAAGWAERQTDALSIQLPSDWEVIDFCAGDLQTVFDNLQKRNPDLARIIGSPEALQDAAFWAFRSVGSAATFADNLNIRRTPLNGQQIEDMQAVVDPVAAQYQELGFQVLAVDANLVIGNQPAAHIVFSFEINTASDQPLSIQGHQYLVATDTDLWILSYSANSDTIAELAPVFQQSAMSFRATNDD